jgi:RNA polymerase-interacting CarD/CdnL/TRCF family regulator
MTIAVGQKVYYVGRGPYLVAEVVSKVVCGATAQFYKLILLGGAGEEFLVPVATASVVPLRALIARSKIPELLRRMGVRSGPPKELGTWQQRQAARSKSFESGSPFDLGDLIESLTRSSSVRKLAIDESEALRRARKLLISEIAEVMGETPTAVESRIDDVLNPDRQTIKQPASRARSRTRGEPEGVASKAARK